MLRHSLAVRLGFTLLALGLVEPVAGQRPARPPTGKPAVIVGPAALTARSTDPGQVILAWPAVADAQQYRITRIANTGDAERLIIEVAPPAAVFEGATCAAGSSQPGCLFIDKRVWPPDPAPNPQVIWHPHHVASGALYTYRVWAVLPGPVITPPSPPATVRVQ